MNLISEKTTKDEMLKEYLDYPDTAPDGFKPFHMSRINPIFWDIEDGSSILDIGCNSGEFMKHLIQGKEGVTVKGIDLSEVAVKAAQAKGLDVVVGDGESLPYPDASFDYVVLMEVIVHTHNPLKLLEEIKRVLKVDGVLIGSAPHKNLEMNIWDDRRKHRAYYTTNELSDLLYKVFPAVYTKVLKGGQFNMGMAGTMLGDQDVEILFKAGSTQLKPWDYRLLERDTLRVWMAPTQTPGDVYYRMSGFADKMNKLKMTDVIYNRFHYLDNEGPGGWQNDLKVIDGRPANRIVMDQLEGLLKIADLSVWQVVANWGTLAFLMAVKEHLHKTIVTEMDDWIFDVPSYNLAANPYQPGSDPERIAFQQIQLSDALIVSTQFIKDNVEALFPGKQVYIVPNALDFSIWDKLENPKKDDKIRIGYTGCGNHEGDMDLIKKPLLAILDEFPNVEVILSVPFKAFDDIIDKRIIRSSTWASVLDFPQMVADWNLDIGIAPLRDSNFNRAKSNLRWLEYSAMKLPTVASAVYPFEKSIKHGKDGFVCRTQREWYDTLKQLIEDREKREQIGNAAYARVKKEFNMDTIAKRYRSILQELKRGSLRTSGRNRPIA